MHASPRTAVNQNKARAEEIKGILEARRSGKEGNATNDPLRTKLNGCRDKFKELVKQKQVLRAQFEAATKTRDAARDAVKELKAMIKFKDVENIESEVWDRVPTSDTFACRGPKCSLTRWMGWLDAARSFDAGWHSRLAAYIFQGLAQGWLSLDGKNLQLQDLVKKAGTAVEEP